MREIHDHKTSTPNKELTLLAHAAGHGGASHAYRILREEDNAQVGSVNFQNGPIHEVGVNGVTHEVLLAIVADRLRGFQTGDFACPENAAALLMIEAALATLKARTLARIARRVEGTSTP